MIVGLKNSGNSALKIDSFHIVQDPDNPCFKFADYLSPFTLEGGWEKEIAVYYTPNYKQLVDVATLQFFTKTKKFEIQIVGVISEENQKYVLEYHKDDIREWSNSERLFSLGLTFLFFFIVVVTIHRLWTNAKIEKII